MISTQQTHPQHAPQNVLKAGRATKELALAQKQFEAAQQTTASLRKGLADAKQELQEAQQLVLLCQQRYQKLIIEFGNSSDAQAAAQGRVSEFQGQLQQAIG
jgi:hypothetical protein